MACESRSWINFRSVTFSPERFAESAVRWVQSPPEPLFLTSPTTQEGNDHDGL